jgi:hypothetical protein
MWEGHSSLNKLWRLSIMMKKETYFQLVDLKKEYNERLIELHHEWNETVCWEGTEEEILEHNRTERDFRGYVNDIDTTLAEARKDIPKDTLKAWSKEYYKK